MAGHRPPAERPPVSHLDVALERYVRGELDVAALERLVGRLFADGTADDPIPLQPPRDPGKRSTR